jgi:hypothetical protein
MLLLKSLGFDVSAVMQNIESAKTTANEVMQHFDRRLQTIEAQLAYIRSLLESKNVQ